MSAYKKSFFTPWYWLLLKLFAFGVLAFLLFSEFTFIQFVLDKPKTIGSAGQSLEYCKGCGLFGPVLYLFSGAVAGISKLSPMMHWFFSIALIINSILLIIWGLILRQLLKHKKWTAILIAILSLLSLLLMLLSLSERVALALPLLGVLIISLYCALTKSKEKIINHKGGGRPANNSP